MIATAENLRHLPLFKALSEAQLGRLLAILKPRSVAAGEVLFSAGEVSHEFQLLVEGGIELVEPNEPKVLLRPFAPIGELGALTGLPRNATATATVPSQILGVPTEQLMKLFAESGDLAFLFYKSLVEVVADKVRRDKIRLDEMRGNLIRTQKAMKELRDLVLSAEENALSQPLCDKLDDLIEHNRRTHYRVSPVDSHPASARLEGGAPIPIVELSEGYLKLAPAAPLTAGNEATFVLSLPRGEIPVSGKVERVGKDGVLLRLDLLIDEYKGSLASYMTELQMLDFVV